MPLADAAEREAREGRTVLFLAVDGRLQAILSAADTVKETAREAIRDLHAEGTTIVVITHDHDIAGSMPRRVSMRDGRIVEDVRP